MKASFVNKPLIRPIRNLLRDWRGGEIRILFFAIVISVSSVTGIGFFVERVSKNMAYHAADLLAADMAVQSSESISSASRRKAENLGLKSTRILTFPSVIIANNKSRLVSIKAVESLYPLRGSLKIRNKATALSVATKKRPGRGKAWIAPELLGDLRLKIGESIKIGYKTFEVEKIIVFEPDQAGEFFNIAPRVLIAFEDIAATKLIAPGSRIKYKLLLAGKYSQLNAFRDWFLANKTSNQKLLSLESSRPAFKSALEQSKRYLGLSALISVLLAGVAIAIAAKRYARKQFDYCALLRCLGAQKNAILSLYLRQLLFLGIIAGVFGCLLGYLAQYLLEFILRDWFPQSLPQPGIVPLISGMLTGVLILFAFALPPIMRLQTVSPLRVIRRNLEPISTNIYLAYATGLSLITIMLFSIAGDFQLAWRLLLVVSVAAFILLLASWLLVTLANITGYMSTGAWKHGIKSIGRHPLNTAIQISGFGIAIMALMLVSIVRGDLIEQWQSRIPKNAPNQFAINIQSNQLDLIRKHFQTLNLAKPKFYSMTRARLVKINQRSVSANSYTSDRAKRLIAREFNLSSASKLQHRNTIIKGKFWHATVNPVHQFSVESGLAKTLGIRLGDSLTYTVAGQSVSGNVTSIRKVAWDTMRPNFFVVAPPDMLQRYPQTWISSFHIPSDDNSLVTKIVRHFPNLTIINIRSAVEQINSIIKKVAATIEYVFVFTLFSGLIVLFATIQSTSIERGRENSLLRALGAKKLFLLASGFFEYFIIGLLAGLLAALGATVAAYVVSTHVLNITFTPNLGLWLSGAVLGGLGVGAAGIIGIRQSITGAPINKLRS